MCSLGVLWPFNSKHTVRNTSARTLVLLCVFSTPHYRKEGAYLTHEDTAVEFSRKNEIRANSRTKLYRQEAEEYRV